MNRLEIDVYSDFVCPWCFIGSRRLQAAVESLDHLDVVTPDARLRWQLLPDA